MPKSARFARAPDPVRAALAAILAVTLYRIALLPFATADLFVDEAQYWLWGQEIAWGYYSKPPLIGWVIRAVTDLAGSDAAFWIRLPGPVLHAASACVMIGAAAQVTDRAAAALVGVAYVTMPAVALGSLLFSTDTVLMPFFAGAVWAWLSLAVRASVVRAVLLGLCVGLGMMAKYAALYFPLCAGLAALFLPAARIAWRDAAVAAGVAALIVAPNALWNLRNDLTTLSHTADNVDWVRSGITLNVAGVAEFLAAQLAVIGPVLFPAYVWFAIRAVRRGGWRERWLVFLSAPILLLVTGQALVSRAYANWAVTACVAALILAVPALWHRARWLLWAGLAANLVLVAALPIAATQMTAWRIDGRLVLARYTGRAALSERVLALAEARGATAIVSDHRDILADLFHTGRDRGVAVYAKPPEGRPPHYYAQRHAYPEGHPGAALYVTFGGPPPCAAERVARWSPESGAYRGREVLAFLVGGNCWGESQG